MNNINLFYKDNNLEDKYNEICMDCPYTCKQSHKSIIVSCKFIKEGGKKYGTRQNRA